MTRDFDIFDFFTGEKKVNARAKLAFKRAIEKYEIPYKQKVIYRKCIINNQEREIRTTSCFINLQESLKCFKLKKIDTQKMSISNNNRKETMIKTLTKNIKLIEDFITKQKD